MKNISLQEAFNIAIDCIINNKELPAFYYKRLNWETSNPEYIEITEIDLLRGSYRTVDGDFSEYEWDLIKSNIYIQSV